MEGLRITKNVKEITFDVVWGELESKNKKSFKRQKLTKYLRLTLILMKNYAQGENLNFYFSRIFF